MSEHIVIYLMLEHHPKIATRSFGCKLRFSARRLYSFGFDINAADVTRTPNGDPFSAKDKLATYECQISLKYIRIRALFSSLRYLSF